MALLRKSQPLILPLTRTMALGGTGNGVYPHSFRGPLPEGKEPGRLENLYNKVLTALQYEDTQIKPDPKTLSEAQHTGAEWSEVDKRNVRFTGVRKYKEVNPNWAVHMVAEDPIVMVHGNHTTCSGGLGAALGHPKVFLNLDRPEPRVCGYCGKRFQQAHHH